LRTLADGELAALAVGGDRAAFGELLRRHASSARVLLRRMGASPALADDLAQDACLKAYERIATFRGDGSFAAWLKTIAARLYIRRWRSESRISWAPELPDDEPDVIAPIAVASDRIDLDKALQVLSEAERVCVSLCLGIGMTHDEAAAELKMPVGTVKSHVHRGLVKMRAYFASDEKCRPEESLRVRA
jgi:RNA polymerase sigma-70 factor (ECF subfamily)